MTRIILLAILMVNSCSQPTKQSRRTKPPGGSSLLAECEGRGQGWMLDPVGKCVCKFRYQLQESDNTCASTQCLETGGEWKDDDCDCDGRDYDEESGCTGLTSKERCEEQGRVWKDECECPEGLHPVKGQCYSAAQKSRVEICEAGTGADIAGTWNTESTKCDCPNGHQEVDSVCVATNNDTNPELACTNSPSGTWTEGVCSCTTPYVVNDGVCRVNQTLVRACTTSLNPGRWLEESPPRCDCSGGGLFLINNRCWTCDAGQIQPPMADSCMDMADLSARRCNAINGLHWHEAYGRCAHHSLAEMALIPTRQACEQHGYTWAYDSCYPGQPDISARPVCDALDLTWSENLGICLGTQTEAQYTAQTETECQGYYDSFLNKCLPRPMPFHRGLCENVYGYAWLPDLQAASAAMVGSETGVCLPEIVRDLSDAEKELRIRAVLTGTYTGIASNAVCSATAENRRVRAWDPELKVCLPGRLPRNAGGTLVPPVTEDQCDRFNRHWIETHYGTGGMGKCYSKNLETIRGYSRNACTPEFYWSARYLRCFPDNPENWANPRNDDRVNRFTQTQCEDLGFEFANNDCRRTRQADFNQITTKTECLATTDGNVTPFWIEYYKRCFVEEPTNYVAAFGNSNSCGNTYSLTWYANNNPAVTSPTGVCLQGNPTTIKQRYASQDDCEFATTRYGDLPGNNARGFQCTDRGFAHFEGEDPDNSDHVTGSTTFNACSSPLRWNSRLGVCTAPAPIVIDSAYCSALGFTWHDTSTAGDIGICTRETLAQIRAHSTRADCEAAGSVWGTYTQGEADDDDKTRESEAIGCLPQALPARGATGAGSQQADRDARSKYERVCNYYAGVTSERTAADKGWLENFQFCMLEHTPGQMLNLAGPAANQAAATSSCEQTGYSWNTNMSLCLPPTPQDINNNEINIYDATRPESLSASFCADINFQFDNSWKTCHRRGINFYDTDDFDNDNDTEEGIYHRITEDSCIPPLERQPERRKGRIVWSSSMSSCFPDTPLRTVQSCGNPSGTARSNTHGIVRDNNECGLVNSLSEAECTQYANRQDPGDARYLNLRWSRISSSCVIPVPGVNCNTATEVSDGERCHNISTFNRDQCRAVDTPGTMWSPLLGARRNSAGTANMQGCFFRTAIDSIFQGGKFNYATSSYVSRDNFFEVNRSATGQQGERDAYARHFECKFREGDNDILAVARSMRAPWRSSVNGFIGSLLCSKLQEGLEVDTSTLRLAGGTHYHVGRATAGGRCTDHDSYEDGECNDIWAKCPEDYVMTGACFTGEHVRCATFDSVAGQQNPSNWHYTMVARCHKIKIRGTDRYLEVTNGVSQTWGHRSPGAYRPSRDEVGFMKVLVGGCNGGVWERHCPHPRNGHTSRTADFVSALRRIAPDSVRSGSNSLRWVE